MSFQRTATKYTLKMEPSTTIPDATSGNAVLDAMMLSLRPHQLHQNRLTPGFPDLCHSLPQLFNEHYNQLHPCSQNQILLSQFLHPQPCQSHPSAYTHLCTECSTCATTAVRPCPHSTKMADHRDVTEEVTVPSSTYDALDPHHPWIMLGNVHLGAGH